MSRLSLICLGAFAVAATAASAAATRPFAADRTSACLVSKRALVSPAAPRTSVPAAIPAIGVLEFSFALISAQALDHGTIVFERDPATAKRAAAAWFSSSVEQAARVQGISMTQAKEIIRASLSLRGNALIVWDNQHVKTASKQRITSCLR